MRRAKYAAVSAVVTAGTAAALVVLSACQGGTANVAAGAGAGGAQGAVRASSSASASIPAPGLGVTPADSSTGVRLDAPVTVSAQNAILTSVRVVDAAGDALAGTTSADGHAWRSTAALAPGTSYRVEASALDDAGRPAVLTSSFTTLTPKKVLGAKIAPLEGETVGVGMPVILYFTEPVANRAAVEQRLTLQESQPVEGAWHWYGDSEVHYRPKAYWPVGDEVTLHADLAGLDAGNSTWGVENHTVHFTIGDSHLSVVDAKTHEMKVEVNGQLARTIPVSTGRDKYPTTSGVHLVLEKEQKVIMDSATVGIPRDSPDGYYETVYWDVRISWSGEFVHAAPWSVGDQGHVNVSHGCVNASTADAEWFYNLSQRGDVVQVINTPRPLESQNGWTDWNMPWSQWLLGSALPMPGSTEGVNSQLSTTDPGQSGFAVYSPTPGPVKKWVPAPPPPAPTTTKPAPSPTAGSPAPTGTATPTPAGTSSSTPPGSAPPGSAPST